MSWATTWTRSWSAPPAEIRFACPYCTVKTVVPARFAGTKGRCSTCRGVVRVPAESTLPASRPDRGRLASARDGASITSIPWQLWLVTAGGMIAIGALVAQLV